MLYSYIQKVAVSTESKAAKVRTVKLVIDDPFVAEVVKRYQNCPVPLQRKVFSSLILKNRTNLLLLFAKMYRNLRIAE